MDHLTNDLSIFSSNDTKISSNNLNVFVHSNIAASAPKQWRCITFMLIHLICTVMNVLNNNTSVCQNIKSVFLLLQNSYAVAVIIQ
jgi:hypothetical protein